MERLYKGCRIIANSYRIGTKNSDNWKVMFQIIAKTGHEVHGNMVEPLDTFPSKMTAETFGISRAKEIIDKK